MFFAACRILTPILSACSWGYFFGFLFYFSLFVTNTLNEVEDGLFRTFFTFGVIGNVQLAKKIVKCNKVDLIAAMHLYGFVAGRASVAEIKNQKDHDQSKKIFINHII